MMNTNTKPGTPPSCSLTSRDRKLCQAAFVASRLRVDCIGAFVTHQHAHHRSVRGKVRADAVHDVRVDDQRVPWSERALHEVVTDGAVHDAEVGLVLLL